MAINIYMNFNGNCREVVEFYADVFQTEQPRIMTFGESPQNPDFPLPLEAKNLVMHSQLQIFGSTIMFSDTFPGQPVVIGNNISLTIVTTDELAIRQSFDRLKESGEVIMELQETFWSKCYGSVTDKFGMVWQLNYESSDVH